MLLGIAIYSSSNKLIYFASTDKKECDELQLQTMAYGSIDVIEERDNTLANKPQELFYGFLLSSSDLKTYGYVTNTKVKFVLIFDALDNTVRDQDIRSYFKQIHLAFANEIANPFYRFGTEINTKRFNRFIGSLFV